MALMYGRIKSFLAAGTAALVAAVSLAVVSASPAAAAISCRGEYFPAGNIVSQWSQVKNTATWTTVASNTTTPYCQDIQVRVGGLPNDYEYFCVVFKDVTSKCNYATTVYRNNAWYTIATNVRDGVRYDIQVFLRNGRSGDFFFDYAG
ncbi:hypothetical protein [Micromonospora sp. CB01531]|uniref:hypothetical protein n=1 Tax=Micromonospora sp. CB01531 TaxID=1718947 RepID=UPI00093A896C|nr:hypothetical protein [Micromonospora sp. CB01531]OKI45479.1 hypothetical protein A6A27_38165 [Micromonospora sp. CB01531]